MKNMTYDIYTPSEELAAALGNLMNKAYLLDASERPDIYQLLDCSESAMSHSMLLLREQESIFEIRASKSGENVWPRHDGLTLDEVLDIQV